MIHKLPVQESFLRGVVCGSGCIGPPLDCQDIQLKVTQITIFLTLWPKNDPVAVVSGGVIKRVLHAHCQIGGNSRVAVAGPGLGLLLLLTPSIVVMTRTGRGRRNVIIIRVPPPPRDTRQQQQRGTRH